MTDPSASASREFQEFCAQVAEKAEQNDLTEERLATLLADDEGQAAP